MSSEAMQMALDALSTGKKHPQAIEALKAELAKPEPEPMKPLGFIWRWKAKEHEPQDINPWQFRDAPVNESNFHLLDVIPVCECKAVNDYRVRDKPADPYAEPRAAAADPTKEIRMRHASGEWSDWASGPVWEFDCPPDRYEIRDKPKVKMWQWLIQRGSGKVYLTDDFHSKAPERFEGFRVIGNAPWTEIEVENE